MELEHVCVGIGIEGRTKVFGSKEVCPNKVSVRCWDADM
jgi:hypothetical protein